MRRLSKLEATVKQIVDGATKGDARATKLLFALIKADERALSEPEGGRGTLTSEADAIVIAELRRRFAAGNGLSRAQRSGADPSPPTPLPQGRGGSVLRLREKAAGGSPTHEGPRRPSPQPSPASGRGGSPRPHPALRATFFQWEKDCREPFPLRGKVARSAG